MRTLAEILEAKLPDNAGEDSFSMLPLFKGSDQPIREHAVSTAASGIPALRSGSWKYIAGPGGKSKEGEPARPVQLYDLASDLNEAKNLATDMPDKVSELQQLLERLITEGRSTPARNSQ